MEKRKEGEDTTRGVYNEIEELRKARLKILNGNSVIRTKNAKYYQMEILYSICKNGDAVIRQQLS